MPPGSMPGGAARNLTRFPLYFVVTTMSFFQRAHYLSDTTQFLQQLKDKKPDMEQKQREGRELLWDKKVDRSLWQEYRAARVPQKSYVYYSYSASDRSTPTR